MTLARALTGASAQQHGQQLGIYKPPDKTKKPKAKPAKKIKIVSVEFLRREIRATKTKDGLRAVSQGKPIEPASVERYLKGKFGDALDDARDAMQQLAKSYAPKGLSANAYKLYGKFTPTVPSGMKGWGAKGELDLDVIRSIARESQ